MNCVFSDLRERDMDLLLMEEFAASQAFANLFLTPVGLTDAVVTSVEQSKTDENGESDITVIVEKNGIKYGLLIEDKIDAEAQPAQASRYRKRGNDGIQKGDYQEFKTFIVAPQKYLDYNAEVGNYDCQVAYETCFAYFSELSDPRSVYKLQQIEQAIDKQKRGYQPIINDAVTDFWWQYRQYKEKNYPDLTMLGDSTGKPSKSTWMYFNTNFRKTHIIHKASQGIVDLEFSGLGEQWQKLRSLCQSTFGNLYEARLSVEQTNKSAVLRSLKSLEALDVNKPFSEQEMAVDIALAEAYRLRLLLDKLPTDALCALWND